MKNFLKKIFGFSGQQTEISPQLEVAESHIFYNNAIWEILAKNEENLTQMNEKMAENDFLEVENIRQNWLKNLEIYRKKITQIGDYQGNDFLLNAANEYLDDFKYLLENGYKKLVEIRIRKRKIEGIDDQKQRDENNQKMELFTKKLNLAIDYFVESYDSDGNPIDHSFKNPILETSKNINTNQEKFSPVHGFTLDDYASFGIFQMQNGTEEELCKILNIELPILHEVFQIWTDRMRNDTTMEIMTKYSTSYAKGITNEKILRYLNQKGENCSDNKKRLQDDEKFYYEVQGAQAAAYKSGIDGTFWVEKYFGISAADMVIASTKWTIQTKNHREMLYYQVKKEGEYFNKIASERQISPANDIEF